MWGSPINDFRGRTIEIFLNNHGLVCLNKGSGTRLNHNGILSHLDLALCSKKLGYNIECDVHDDTWGSDHYPVFVNLGFNAVENFFDPNIYNYKKADWSKFCVALEDDTSLLEPTSSVEEGYKNLVLAFKRARDISIPKCCKSFKHKYTPFWTPSCSAAKADKKQAEKSLRKHNTIENQIAFKKSKSKFKRILSNAKTNFWEKFCLGISKQTKLKHVWDTISKLKGKNRNRGLKIKDTDGTLVSKDLLPDLFAEKFQLNCSDSNLHTDSINGRGTTVAEFLQSRQNPSSLEVKLSADSQQLNEPFKLSELTRVLKTVNVNSSPGCDDIPFSLFKHSPIYVLDYFLNIINLSFNSNTIPVEWKTSIIKPILKQNKKPCEIASYRPISLTSSFSKLFEKMITSRLTWFLVKNNVLNPNHAGFRKSFSTGDPIIRLSHEAEIAVNSGNYTVAIMIDFTCAFDLLWIDGLIIKMMKLSISGKFLNWIKNFLSNRTNRVKIDNFFSNDFSQQNGTPQGSTISPILFLIMVNDFPALSQYTYDAFFADDCTVWRSGNNLSLILHHLQLDLNLISSWCLKWGFKINSLKTTGIIFSNKNIASFTASLNIDGRPIIFYNTVKLLGVMFDSHMTWKAHIDYLVQKSVKGLNLIRCISGTSWGANQFILLVLYKSLILSSLDYCCFTYDSSASTSNLNKLKSIQYKSLLIATGAMRGTSLNALLGECAELPLLYRRKKIILNYLTKLNFNSCNSAKEVLTDKKYFQLGVNNKSKYKIFLDKFLSDKNITPFSITSPCYISCSCTAVNQNIDITFLDHVDNKTETSTLDKNSKVLDILITLAQLFDYVFFVDGSVKQDGKVGAAVYSPALYLELTFKLPDFLPIYFAEGFAVLQALLYAKGNDLINFCIISDNAKLVTDLYNQTFDSSSHPSLLHAITSSYPTSSSCHFLIKWLPSLSTIPCFNTVDSLATLATTLTTITPIDWSWHEVAPLIDEWAWGLWLHKWGNNPEGTYQCTYAPTSTISRTFSSRRHQIIANRIKLLHSKLNWGLYKIGKHDDGTCEVCSIKEDNNHFLIECSKTAELRKEIRNRITLSPDKWKYGYLTTIPCVIDLMVKFIIVNNISF